jgi:hypothetical protein
MATPNLILEYADQSQPTVPKNWNSPESKSIAITRPEQNDEKGQQKSNWYEYLKPSDWLLVLFTALLVFYTRQLFSATLGLRNATDRLVEAGDRQIKVLVNTQRPVFHIHSWDTQIDVDSTSFAIFRYRFAPVWMNGGQAVAINVKSWSLIVVMDVVPGKNIEDVVFKDFDKGRFGPSSVGNGGTIKPSYRQLSAQIIEDIYEKKKRAFIGV